MKALDMNLLVHLSVYIYLYIYTDIPKKSSRFSNSETQTQLQTNKALPLLYKMGFYQLEMELYLETLISRVLPPYLTPHVFTHLLQVSEDDSPELAAAIFHDAGFVVLPNAVDLELCNELLEVCRQDMVAGVVG